MKKLLIPFLISTVLLAVTQPSHATDDGSKDVVYSYDGGSDILLGADGKPLTGKALKKALKDARDARDKIMQQAYERIQSAAREDGRGQILLRENKVKDAIAALESSLKINMNP